MPAHAAAHMDAPAGMVVDALTPPRQQQQQQHQQDASTGGGSKARKARPRGDTDNDMANSAVRGACLTYGPRVRIDGKVGADATAAPSTDRHGPVAWNRLHPYTSLPPPPIDAHRCACKQVRFVNVSSLKTAKMGMVVDAIVGRVMTSAEATGLHIRMKLTIAKIRLKVRA